MQTVTNAVPVSKTRTVQTYQPVTRTQTVTKDYGHWEDRVEEVAVASLTAASGELCSRPSGLLCTCCNTTHRQLCAVDLRFSRLRIRAGTASGRGHGCIGRLFHRVDAVLAVATAMDAVVGI